MPISTSRLRPTAWRNATKKITHPTRNSTSATASATPAKRSRVDRGGDRGDREEGGADPRRLDDHARPSTRPSSASPSVRRGARSRTPRSLGPRGVAHRRAAPRRRASVRARPATASGSSPWTMRPVTPSMTASSDPPLCPATCGTPHAAASRKTMPKPSCSSPPHRSRHSIAKTSAAAVDRRQVVVGDAAQEPDRRLLLARDALEPLEQYAESSNRT